MFLIQEVKIVTIYTSVYINNAQTKGTQYSSVVKTGNNNGRGLHLLIITLQHFNVIKRHFHDTMSVADPGFPRGGGANSPGGAPTYDFDKFSQKLHEIERIWTGGGRVQNFTM